eukprot:TRINITY_DN94500_c0_g1_i1.p1 TRINITY_DN94500_c0_g1~~TRINITY_DN94500_c0_g1_i1.p1  ORF type:complete len:301 (-),score=59.23 TRINITY_DN94500_c0_g1_i1:4-906(-)
MAPQPYAAALIIQSASRSWMARKAAQRRRLQRTEEICFGLRNEAALVLQFWLREFTATRHHLWVSNAFEAAAAAVVRAESWERLAMTQEYHAQVETLLFSYEEMSRFQIAASRAIFDEYWQSNLPLVDRRVCTQDEAIGRVFLEGIEAEHRLALLEYGTRITSKIRTKALVQAEQTGRLELHTAYEDGIHGIIFKFLWLLERTGRLKVALEETVGKECLLRYFHEASAGLFSAQARRSVALKTARERHFDNFTRELNLIYAQQEYDRWWLQLRELQSFELAKRRTLEYEERCSRTLQLRQ